MQAVTAPQAEVNRDRVAMVLPIRHIFRPDVFLLLNLGPEQEEHQWKSKL